MATQIYMTTKAIQNPRGDGRHNRAEWRSYLDKTSIPAGFVFGITDDGGIEDRSQAIHTIPPKQSAGLRKLLLDASGHALGTDEVESPVAMQPVETLETVLGEVPSEALPSLLRALGLSPPELRKLLIEVTSSPAH